MLISRALVLSGPSGPSGAWGWSLGSLLNSLSPECCPETRLFGRDDYVFWISHFASGISSASSFSQSLLWALRQTLPLVFHMAMIFNSQMCLESGICIFSRRALSLIGVGLMGWCPGIYTWVGICGRVMHRDLWSYYYSRKGGALMWLFPLCWQQQSR